MPHRAPAPLSLQAFLTLLMLACMMGGNHVAARVAFDHGLDVPTAVAVRSLGTAAVVGLLVWLYQVPRVWTRRQGGAMLLIGLLVTVQSACLYSSVARIPVGLALLAFNTYPLWAAFMAWALYRHRPARAVLVAMPVILVGLALALNVSGIAAGLGARTSWADLSVGVGFAVVAAATFGLVLALTQHEVAALDGRLRTWMTMTLVGAIALIVAVAGHGLHWPQASVGWWGLAALTALFGTGFTLMFTLPPKLGVVGSSPILNVEPVAGMAIAWFVLGQAVAPNQWLGALLVVGAVIALGLWRG